VIRVSWMPLLSRSRRRGPQLVRVRRRPRRGPAKRAVDRAPIAAVSWDGEPAPRAPLPTATLVRGAGAAQTLMGELRGWLAGQAAWLRPRAIPMAVAFAGMLAVLIAMALTRALASQLYVSVAAFGLALVAYGFTAQRRRKAAGRD